MDALGELASVGGTETWWDTAAVVPTLISVDDTPLLGLPGGVTAIGDAWTTPGWRSARATDPTDPWAVLGQVAGLDLPTGVGLTARGGVTLAGLEWLGARVYDPAARGFLSTAPLAPVTGAAWSGNPYSYAGNDPLHALDPWGLRPATDADLDAYAHATQGAFKDLEDWANEHADVISSIAVGVGIGLTIAAMFTPLGPIAAIALAAGAGAALSGGLSIQSNKGPDGKVAWGQVGLDTLVGGAAGAAGGGAALGLSKLAPTVAQVGAPAVQRAASTVLGSTGRAAISSGVSGAVANTGTYAFDPRVTDRSAEGYAASAATGFGTGALFSLGSRGLGNAAIGKPATTLTPAGDLTNRVIAPEIPAKNAVATGTIDHAMGGVASVANEWLRPGGKRGLEDLPETLGTGVLSGAHGPTVGVHRAP